MLPFLKKGGISLPQTFNAQAVKALLDTHTLGNTIEFYEQLPSTNDTAKACASTAAHGTVILADRQTAGRGRFTRQFFSPQQDGIYMSVILRHGIKTDTVGLLTCATAVAVARAIEALIPATVHIKWVNDLLIHGKKVCGILTEASLTPDGTYDFAVIGIGINVSTLQFPAELDAIASSLLKECGVCPDRAALCAAVLRELETVLDKLESRAFLQESRTRSAVLGKDITVICGDRHYTAHALDIDDDGGLVVQTENGIHTVRSGEVSVCI